MSLYGLLLPAEQEICVVSDDHWHAEAVSDVLGGGPSESLGLDWTTNPAHWLLIVAGIDGPVNDKANALANTEADILGGPYAVCLRGDALVLALSHRTGQVVSLERRDLVILAVRLLIGEAQIAALTTTPRPAIGA